MRGQLIFSTFRSCTQKSLEFCQAMAAGGSKETLADAFIGAIAAHRQYTSEAISGQGIDRHLLGRPLLQQCLHPRLMALR